ncbi:hypothetical protein AMTR_s00013p00227560, partial [Amborella trichopoda]
LRPKERKKENQRLHDAESFKSPEARRSCPKFARFGKSLARSSLKVGLLGLTRRRSSPF